MINILDENKIDRLLSAQNFGHLGCVLENGDPYVVPVNYVYLDNELYVHTLPGKKLDALRANARVCLQIENIEGEYGWQSAVITGDFIEEKSHNQIIRVMQEFYLRFKRLTPVEAKIDNSERNPGGTVVFRIIPRKISGIGEI